MTSGNARIGGVKRYRNVQRVDKEKSFHGWVVQIKRRGAWQHMEYFRDGAHGGRAGALRRALSRRDELESKLPPPTHLKGRDKRNTTGVVGVCLVVKRRAGGVWRYYWATWTELSGEKVVRRFSVQEHGEERACALAKRARREAVKRILSRRGRVR